MTSVLEFQQNLLAARLSGPASFEDVSDGLAAIWGTSAEKGYDRILVDCSDLQADLTTAQRFKMGNDGAEGFHRRKHYPSIALIGRPPVIDGFGILVGRNRGINARLFSDRSDGVEWLMTQ